MAVTALLAFNRGRVSQLALARTDFARLQFSAEIQTNWMPRALGSMMLRAGLGYTGATRNHLTSISIPFVFAIDDAARVEVTNSTVRVWVDDELVTRPEVGAAVVNGAFTTNLNNWTDVDAGSAASTWIAPGYLKLVGTGNAAAKRRQEVAVADADVRHALNIAIARGPVLLRVGSTAGADDYISETTLETGYHSLAFTPTGASFWIDLFSYAEAASLVDSVAVASAGVMEVTAPWAEADLLNLRWDQSGDVIFVACAGYRQQRIERRATDSWSVVEYKSNDGPFRVQNVGPITMTPSQTSGDCTITASAPYFKSTQLGALLKLTHTGQLQDADLDGSDQFCDPIRVFGIDDARRFSIFVDGTWSGTLTLQYAQDAAGPWADATVGGSPYTLTANTAISYDDTLDNQILYYRMGFKAGDYVSGTATVTLTSSGGAQSGIARVTAFTSSTVVEVAVLAEFANVTATADWAESYWSERRGFPSAVGFGKGRLWWEGQDRIWGSASDAYDSFDDEIEGDAGPINRSIGTGAVDTIYWMTAGKRLLLGAAGGVYQVYSSSLDEPITPTSFNIDEIDTPGSGSRNVAAIKSGTAAVYVQQGGTRVYEATVGDNGYDYSAVDLSVHVPEIGQPGIVKLVEQYQPERRRHCIRSDGTVAILIFDRAEEVKCWIDFETDGEVEDAIVLPGTVEDQVYYTVKRRINAADVRFHEKWAMESECQGGTLNKQADAFLTGSGLVTGLSHLEGCEVVIWADGEDQGTDEAPTFTVTDGSVLEVTADSWVAGLLYEARFKSTKLAYAVEGGTALNMRKQVERLGVVARNIHHKGLRYGPDFDNLDDMPDVEDGASVPSGTIHETYDAPTFTFDGRWDTDSRVCLLARAPRPVTLLAAVIQMTTRDK